MVTTNGTKTSLRDLIRNEAMAESYKYDESKHQIYGRGELFLATKEEFDRLTLHQNICKHLVCMSREFGDYPLTSLVYIAIGGSAHKQNVFREGYSKFNAKKTRKILKWLEKLSKHCKDERFMRRDVIVHALVKFYDKVSQDDKTFNSVLSQFKPDGRTPSNWKNMEAFYAEFMKPMFENIVIDINN